MANKTRLRAAEARKIPHPNNDITSLSKLSLLVRCEDMPTSISFDPNPREANEKSRNKKIYKAVKQSLLGESEYGTGFFDLMNRGIVIIVKSAQFIEKDQDGYSIFDLEIPEGYGLADGGHTFKIISEINQDTELKPVLQSHNQHVEVRVIELPDLKEAESLIPAIGLGLNSSLQVDEMSIANLDGKFDPLKDVLEKRFATEIALYPQKEDYEGLFGWKQTDVAYIDAKEIVTLISALDNELWGDKSPVGTYSSPATTLSKVLRLNRIDKYLKIAGDALTLYNTVQGDFRNQYNDGNGNKRAGSLSIVENNRSGEFTFPFAQIPDSQYRLMKGASLPIFSAFRVFTEYDSDGFLVWKNDFSGISNAWKQYAPILISRTLESSGKHQRNVANAIGKDSTHWRNLRNELLLASKGLV